MNEVTQLLSAIEQGDTRTVDQLFPLVYDALRELAATNRALVHRQMQHGFKDEDLASVRGPEVIARLPVDERDAWNQLWAEVRALRGQTVPRSGRAPRQPGASAP
jgi:hypothetical protein